LLRKGFRFNDGVVAIRSRRIYLVSSNPHLVVCEDAASNEPPTRDEVVEGV